MAKPHARQRLRRKLEVDARFPQAIVTDRSPDGVGYVFALDVERM